MSKRFGVLAVVAAICIAISPVVQTASAGGGNGGGGSTKPIKVVYTGYLTDIQPVEGGYLVQIGTSYYNIATNVLITADTSIKLNGVSAEFADILVGDYVQVSVNWPSKVGVKLEAIGAR